MTSAPTYGILPSQNAFKADPPTSCLGAKGKLERARRYVRVTGHVLNSFEKADRSCLAHEFIALDVQPLHRDGQSSELGVGTGKQVHDVFGEVTEVKVELVLLEPIARAIRVPSGAIGRTRLKEKAHHLFTQNHLRFRLRYQA